MRCDNCLQKLDLKSATIVISNDAPRGVLSIDCRGCNTTTILHLSQIPTMKSIDFSDEKFEESLTTKQIITQHKELWDVTQSAVSQNDLKAKINTYELFVNRQWSTK